jgi:hypothetical protein
MNIRPFKPDDAESCFRLRSNAIIQKFHSPSYVTNGTEWIDLDKFAVKIHLSQPFALRATTSPARLASDSVAGRRYIKSLHDFINTDRSNGGDYEQICS